MDLLYPLFWLVSQLIWIFIIVVFVRVVMTWLVQFEILNRRNAVVAALDDIARQMTEPALAPARRLMQRLLPQLGGIDLSPLIVILIAYVVQMYLWIIYFRLA